MKLILNKLSSKRSKYLQLLYDEFVNDPQPEIAFLSSYNDNYSEKNIVIELPDTKYISSHKEALVVIQNYLSSIPDYENYKLPTPLQPVSRNHNNQNTDLRQHFKTICMVNAQAPLVCFYELLHNLSCEELCQVAELANYLDLDILVHNTICFIKILSLNCLEF